VTVHSIALCNMVAELSCAKLHSHVVEFCHYVYLKGQCKTVAKLLWHAQTAELCRYYRSSTTMLLFATVCLVAHWIIPVRSLVSFGHRVIHTAFVRARKLPSLTLTPGCYQLEADNKLVLDDTPCFFVTKFQRSMHHGFSRLCASDCSIILVHHGFSRLCASDCSIILVHQHYKPRENCWILPENVTFKLCCCGLYRIVYVNFLKHQKVCIILDFTSCLLINEFISTRIMYKSFKPLVEYRYKNPRDIFTDFTHYYDPIPSKKVTVNGFVSVWHDVLRQVVMILNYNNVTYNHNEPVVHTRGLVYTSRHPIFPTHKPSSQRHASVDTGRLSYRIGSLSYRIYSTFYGYALRSKVKVVSFHKCKIRYCSLFCQLCRSVHRHCQFVEQTSHHRHLIKILRRGKEFFIVRHSEEKNHNFYGCFKIKFKQCCYGYRRETCHYVSVIG
jgi:hypothetical protein